MPSLKVVLQTKWHLLRARRSPMQHTTIISPAQCCPTEILLCIIDELGSSASAGVHHPRWYSDPEHELFFAKERLLATKNAALTCRSWYTSIVPILYQKPLITSPDALTRMRYTLRHRGDLSRNVQQLIIVDPCVANSQSKKAISHFKAVIALCHSLSYILIYYRFSDLLQVRVLQSVLNHSSIRSLFVTKFTYNLPRRTVFDPSMTIPMTNLESLSIYCMRLPAHLEFPFFPSLKRMLLIGCGHPYGTRDAKLAIISTQLPSLEILQIHTWHPGTVTADVECMRRLKRFHLISRQGAHTWMNWPDGSVVEDVAMSYNGLEGALEIIPGLPFSLKRITMAIEGPLHPGTREGIETFIREVNRHHRVSFRVALKFWPSEGVKAELSNFSRDLERSLHPIQVSPIESE